MKMRGATPPAASQPIVALRSRRQLFRKYVGLFATVVCVALVVNGLLDILFSFREQNVLLMRIQQEQARSAATKISQYIKEIEGQLAWATLLPWSTDTLEEWRVDAFRLFRLVAAVTEVAQLDAAGHEQIRLSQLVKDRVGSQIDYSQEDFFVKAVANKIYYGPVHFRRESEPYMTLAMAGVRRDYGVIVAQVNLKFIWDVVSQIRVGVRGRAYVVDPAGRLIAHPDISMVLRNTDLSRLAQFRTALAEGSASPSEQPLVTDDIEGRTVLSVHGPVGPLGWLVFVELPVDEAYAPLYASIQRSAAVLLAALVLAAFAGLYLARRMTIPIRALHDGAVRIHKGDLDQRISIKTGDELEALGEQFNRMAAQLQDSYASLERKVEERTHQLALANLAKSRFLAAASHDLRQPLHALGLFIAQLRGHMKSAEGGRLVERIDAAVLAMNELFNALLDISKLDAGVLAANIVEFPVAQLLRRIDSTFADAAREKGLSFQLVNSSAWARSDPILLERIVLNLVSNAVRYTAAGTIVVGCRRRGDALHIEVWDSGPGIPEDQQRNIFGEFYRLAGENTHGGLGLGLAIVDRYCNLLGHPIRLVSTVGKGSRFSVAVPMAAARVEIAELPGVTMAVDATRGKLVVVIDDDALVLDSMGGLLRNWGCRVVAAATPDEVLVDLDPGERPDLIICDYRLANGESGIAAIADLRKAYETPVPAFIMSGDTTPERLREARESGHLLLHKPVRAMALRAMINRLLKTSRVAGAA
jgi:signal transduction histidine kinase